MGESLPSPGPYSPVSNSSITGHPLQSPALSYASSLNEGEEQDSVLLLERRSFRPFKSSEDYLYAMREDLAEWLNGLYDLSISVDDFFERLENGVLLCEHANNVRVSAQEHLINNGKKLSVKYEIPPYEVYYRKQSAPGSFFARDNVHNFIRWCRDLGVHDVLMFETDDLVLRKNEKHVILALLEIARRGARFGMAAPLLVQMEADIDREIEKDRLMMESQSMAEGDSMVTSWVDDVAKEEPEEPPHLIYGPQPQVVTNDLKSLDEMVRDLVERCTCPSQFPMIKVSEGKYRIGDTKVLIFVRILRNHVMVRVGGGWDTLHHYLDKHDPCRCKSGHRSTIASKLGFKHSHSGDRDLKSVSYKRTDEAYSPSSPAMARRKSSGFRREGSEGRTTLRNRSQSPALRDPNQFGGSSRFAPKFANTRDESSANGEMWCDSSSEVSDEGYKSQGPPRASLRARRLSPKKISVSDLLERPDSSMTQLSSEGSSVSTDDSGVPSSPPRSPPTGVSRPWLGTGTKIPRSSTPKGKILEKPGYIESLIANKKQKSKSVSDAGRRAWNAGPGVNKDTTPRSRRSSVSDTMDGHTISRSRSATSDGGFQSLLLRKDSIGRQSMRSLPRRPENTAKNTGTWNGRSGRNYPSVNQESFRPPIGARSVRSASASPATVRRTFGSAPVTPLNRSPKRSAPASTVQSPTHTHDYLPGKVEFDKDDENADLLAHIEDLVNDYRTKVYNMFLSEGKPMPPELVEEDPPSAEAPVPVSKGIKGTPRKSGLGSRIPAPVF